MGQRERLGQPPLRIMKSLWKIGLSVAVLSAASILWWLHREKAIAERNLLVAASESRALAEHGDVKAEFTLARMYADGKGVPQSYALASVWYRKAAEQGYAKAQFNLGQMYLRGQGVGKDYAEALKWIQRAADQGDARAEASLAFMYYNGQGWLKIMPQLLAGIERQPSTVTPLLSRALLTCFITA